MQLIIKLADYEIISQGLVHISSGNPLRIEIGGLVFSFEFIKDESEGRYAAEVVNGKTLNMKLYNFDNPLGQGKLEPIEVGTLGEHQLAVSFYSWRPNMDSEARLFNYVFYKGKATLK